MSNFPFISSLFLQLPEKGELHPSLYKFLSPKLHENLFWIIALDKLSYANYIHVPVDNLTFLINTYGHNAYSAVSTLTQVDLDEKRKKNVKRQRKTFEVTKRQSKQAGNHDLRKNVFLF